MINCFDKWRNPLSIRHISEERVFLYDVVESNIYCREARPSVACGLANGDMVFGYKNMWVRR
jgi:hypothetical protein